MHDIVAGVRVHQSPLLENNSIAVQGRDGLLLVDPGVTRDELADLASSLDQPVVAGFATHPDWDHVLWHAALGDAPRFGTARCAAEMRELLATAEWRERVAEVTPPEIVDEVPYDDLFGRITALPEGATTLPWDGPEVRIIEHNAHAAGHAALLVEEFGVLIAGDMLSDVLVPMLDFGVADPVGDYLAALDLLDGVAGEVEIVIPGHGSAGTDVKERIALDRAYVLALRDGGEFTDPRIGPDAKPGWEWVADLHAGLVENFGKA